ncbi:glycosyltransferase family 4 protein [Aliiroseovarius marinus]|uniref:glycosyltransferase family 4 protein n=1 Tax=Aliiroseovarius marinus TaxID=2500159 RepID=UPI003D7EAD4E
MKIILTVNAAWNALNFRRPVIEALLARGDDVVVLAPADDSVPMLEALGCECVDLEMDVSGLSPLRDGALALRMGRHFARLAPDAILGYTIKNNLFGAVAARRLGIPFLPNVSGLGTAFLSGGALQYIAETLYRHAFRNLPTVFFQNPEDSDLFISRNLTRPAQVTLLPGSGIDLQRFSPRPKSKDKTTRFLMVSRLLRDKGVLEYVDAARLLKAEGARVEFQMIGATQAENRSVISEDDLAAWQAEGAISHLGETNDVRPFIAQADCVVLPSYREGAPRTLIEAAAMARPLIATDVPGCRQVVEHGTTGLLCAVRDGHALADACRQFLAMPEDARNTMGKAGRAKMVSEYDQRLVVQAYLTAIDAQTRPPQTAISDGFGAKNQRAKRA